MASYADKEFGLNINSEFINKDEKIQEAKKSLEYNLGVVNIIIDTLIFAFVVIAIVPAVIFLSPLSIVVTGPILLSLIWTRIVLLELSKANSNNIERFGKVLDKLYPSNKDQNEMEPQIKPDPDINLKQKPDIAIEPKNESKSDINIETTESRSPQIKTKIWSKDALPTLMQIEEICPGFCNAIAQHFEERMKIATQQTVEINKYLDIGDKDTTNLQKLFLDQELIDIAAKQGPAEFVSAIERYVTTFKNAQKLEPLEKGDPMLQMFANLEAINANLLDSLKGQEISKQTSDKQKKSYY